MVWLAVAMHDLAGEDNQLLRVVTCTDITDEHARTNYGGDGGGAVVVGRKHRQSESAAPVQQGSFGVVGALLDDIVSMVRRMDQDLPTESALRLSHILETARDASSRVDALRRRRSDRSPSLGISEADPQELHSGR